jgi:hypothetical protein
MKTATWTPAQIAASQSNGSRSLGPKTSAGKMVSALNAVSTGIEARCILLGDETLEDHRQLVHTWVETFRPVTPGEAFLVAKIADLFMRLSRVDRQEERLRESGVESEVMKTETSRRLGIVCDSMAAIKALAETAESVQTVIPFEHLAQLAPAMKRTLEMVEAADAPMALLVPLRDAMNDVVVSSFTDVEPASFHAVAAAAREVEAWLTVLVTTVRAELEAARGDLAMNPTVADEDLLRRLDRHRARLHRQLDAHLELLQRVRSLAAPDGGSSGSFIQVELRVAGRPNLAKP